MEDAIKQTSSDLHVPAANTDAVLTYAADANMRHAVAAVLYSYSAAPTGGRLTIKDGTTVVFDLDIPGAGPGVVQFDPPLFVSANANMVITLAAGGGTVAGKVNARHFKI